MSSTIYTKPVSVFPVGGALTNSLTMTFVSSKKKKKKKKKKTQKNPPKKQWFIPFLLDSTHVLNAFKFHSLTHFNFQR